MPSFLEDPDVDILMTDNLLKVLVDLRESDLKIENLQIKADNHQLYIFDRENRNVVKIINLPSVVDPKSISLHERFGTFIITLKKT